MSLRQKNAHGTRGDWVDRRTSNDGNERVENNDEKQSCIDHKSTIARVFHGDAKMIAQKH